MRLVFSSNGREHTSSCKHSSFLLVLLVFTIALIYEAECGFMRRFFNKEDLRSVITEPKTKQDDKGTTAKNLDTRTAALVEELSRLDQRLAARRRREGRLDNYSQLMAKAQDHNQEYDYHKHEESYNCEENLQQSGTTKLTPKSEPSQGLQRSGTLKILPMSNVRDKLQNSRIIETPLESNTEQCELSDCDLYQPSGNLYESRKPDYGNLKSNAKVKHEHNHNSVLPKFLGNAPTYLRKKVTKVCQTTKKGLLEFVQQASDSISLLLKLDKKGRLLALIEEVDKAMVFVRKEYSKFVITWTPLMEDALNYLGCKDLHYVKWDEKDEFDLRQDALIMLAVGHEFHLLMLNWRDELLLAHSAYKLYLESVKHEALEGPTEGSSKVIVDDFFLFQLEAIHNYVLFKAWLTIDEVNLESRMKLAYLFNFNDGRLKNYESDYFRHIIIFQELFEPTLDEFKSERRQVIDSVSTAGVMRNDFEEVDEFIDDYRASMSADKQSGKITVPVEMLEFVDRLKRELQYNPRLYDFEFLTDLKEAKRRLMEE